MTDQTAGAFPEPLRAKPVASQPQPPGTRKVFRHSIFVRMTHWIWVVSLAVLFMSGLQIFNAHPSLNFGQTTTFDKDAAGPNRLILDIDNDGEKGVTSVLGHTFDTTGVLGVSKVGGDLQARGFPSWLTIPGYQDLSTGRRWHFLFAWILVINGFVYLAYGLVSGHLWRDLVPRLRDWRAVPRDILEHLKMHFVHGPDAPQYNALQKITYALILFVVLPVLVLAGIEMSPGLDAVVPWLRDAFGGRQSARTIHFLLAWTLVAFVVVHVAMVIVSGLWNNLRSMVTGRFSVKEPGPR